MSHYAYKENGQFVWPVAMRSRFNDVRAWHTLTDERRALEEWYSIEYTNLGYDPSLQEQTLISERLEGNVFKVEYSLRSFSAYEHAEKKKDVIRRELENSFDEPIEELSLFWDAGFNSSLSIDGAARISENAGNTTVTIHDSDNKPQELTIAEAIQVAAVIGSDYQTKFALKQARMVQVDDVDKTATNAIELIRAI